MIRAVSVMPPTLRSFLQPVGDLPDIRISPEPHPPSIDVEIRSYVTSQVQAPPGRIPQHKIGPGESPEHNEESCADLKRILKQRIQDLENWAPIPSRTARAAKIAHDADCSKSSRPTPENDAKLSIHAGLRHGRSDSALSSSLRLI